ncbi:hypothetical protein [Nonomuraea sp. NPDC049158]|uniref:hypothetical protein n=1 Tax=Nonomuraea sp. NPDC049158 TaxID=3155649 RepID=UPI0033F3062F
MNAATVQAVICLILGIVAVATFMIKGKQWPTFITATLFGMYAGATTWGGAITRAVTSMAGQLLRSMQ